MTTPPKSLFKYVCPERISILKDLEICFPQPGTFNDPFELRPSIGGFDDGKQIEGFAETALRQRYRKYCLLNDNRWTSFEEFKQDAIRHKAIDIEALKKQGPLFQNRINDEHLRLIDATIGILCLSEIENDVLLWAHYTDSHKGMVIEFDATHPFFSVALNPLSDIGRLVKIKYSPDRPRLNYPYDTEDGSIFLIKSEQWGYEKEWRFIQRLAKRTREKKLPDGTTVYLFALPPAAIKRIVMGCRMEDSVRQSLINEIKRNPFLSHVVVEKAVRDPDRFRLVYKSIQQEPPTGIEFTNSTD